MFLARRVTILYIFFTSLHVAFTRALHMVMITPIVGGLRASPVRSWKRILVRADACTSRIHHCRKRIFKERERSRIVVGSRLLANKKWIDPTCHVLLLGCLQLLEEKACSLMPCFLECGGHSLDWLRIRLEGMLMWLLLQRMVRLATGDGLIYYGICCMWYWLLYLIDFFYREICCTRKTS